MDETSDDFWHMCIQEHVKIVIQLCRFEESESATVSLC